MLYLKLYIYHYIRKGMRIGRRGRFYINRMHWKMARIDEYKILKHILNDKNLDRKTQAELIYLFGTDNIVALAIKCGLKFEPDGSIIDMR